MKTTIQHIFLTLALLLSVAGTASSQTFIRGDVNGDGEIDITDVTVLVDYLNTGNFNLVARTLSFAENTTAVNKTYGDAAFTITATPSAGSGDGTLSYSSSTTSVATVDATTGEVTIVGIGETTITASITASANYAAAQKSYTLTVSQATISPTLTLAGWTYGSPNSPSVTGNTGNGVVTYYYKTGESEWTTTQPTAAGTHQVKACIAAASNYTAAETDAVEFTISQLEAVLNWSNTSLPFNGTEQQPTCTVGNLVSGDECTVTVEGAQTNVGNYTATASALSNSNYSLPSANTQEWSITAVAASITTAPAAVSEALIYTGSAQELVSAGDEVTGGSLKYFVNTTGEAPTTETEGWIETVPTGTNADTYYVWYYVAADDNHVSTAVTAIEDATKSISPKEVTVSSGIIANSKPYDGTTTATLDCSSAVVTDKVDGDELTVSATGTFEDVAVGTNITVTISDIMLGGSSASNYTLAATGNQTSTTADITKAAGSVTLSSSSISFAASNAVNSTKTFTISENISGGTLSVESSDDTKVSASIDGTTVTLTRLVASAISNVTITVTSDATDYYESAQATCTVSAAAVDPGVALSSSGLGYIVGSNGKAYPVSMKNSLPAGVTAAGVVTYKSGSSGIVVALRDCSSNYTWAYRNTGLNTVTAVSGRTWICGSKNQYSYALGIGESTADGVWNTKKGYITAAGGTTPSAAWTDTALAIGSDAYYFANGIWRSSNKSNTYTVRPLFAF